MRKLFILLLLLGVSYCAGAQGYALRFNRVIDTVFVANLTTCTILTSAGQNGTTLTVPANCVWKVESVGPAGVSGNTLYGDCNYNGGYIRGLSSVFFIDSQGERGYLYKYEYASAWGAYSPSGTVWLSAGTQVIANIAHASSTSYYSTGCSVSNPWYIRLPVTIIEFIKVTP